MVIFSSAHCLMLFFFFFFVFWFGLFLHFFFYSFSLFWILIFLSMYNSVFCSLFLVFLCNPLSLSLSLFVLAISLFQFFISWCFYLHLLICLICPSYIFCISHFLPSLLCFHPTGFCHPPLFFFFLWGWVQTIFQIIWLSQ